MTESTQYQELQLVNQLLEEALSQLDTVFEKDLEESESLAKVLQGLVSKRQQMLQQWLSTTSAADLAQLQAQQQLTHELEQGVTTFKQRYADELATRKSNTQKLNLYKTLDAER
ncbi:hypothetical protein JYB87_13360 [Shewanella avicenniae]|uniref:Flagellar protein FliT n=1 Tax=Shewanella avicenniae TaxID=2814294 RepID=A0ABX7QMQ9_9GAMM|nr:hypothetical protein [Shewanella avicenniae]QSX32729.1 hypothetical protein JYB87_13360 [Shewanella avicenniae]